MSTALDGEHLEIDRDLVDQPVEALEGDAGPEHAVLVPGPGHDPVVVEDERRQAATDRALGQRRRGAASAGAHRPERDPRRVTVPRPHDRVHPQRLALVAEAQVETFGGRRQRMAAHLPATGGWVEPEAIGQLQDGRRREVRPPAGQRREDCGIDAQDVDPAAGLAGAALAEDGDGPDVVAQGGVAVDRHDGRGDRQAGAELGHPHVQP
jgi:hypothetical protein